MACGALLGMLLWAASGEAQAQSYGGLVRCESRGYSDNYCPVNTRGGVRLLRKFSRSECWEGESWGYDRRGIWVTQGCGAEFEIGGGGRGDGYSGRGDDDFDDDYGDRHGDYGDRHGDYGDRGRGGQAVLCESRDFRYNYCATRIDGDVKLVSQRSKSECRFNRSWGWDRGGIWVDRGCAAEFAVH